MRYGDEFFIIGRFLGYPRTYDFTTQLKNGIIAPEHGIIAPDYRIIVPDYGIIAPDCGPKSWP